LARRRRVADKQREEFERRVVALIRNQLEDMEKEHPGYEIGDFVLTFEFFDPPLLDPGEELGAWVGGRYGGWWPNGQTFGSSSSWYVDRRLVWDAWLYVDRKWKEDEMRRENRRLDNDQEADVDG
jgi:hypothetical protein